MKRGLWIAGIAALLGAPLGWHVSDRLESDNRFCVSCHLGPDEPLHERKLRDFQAEPAVNLVAAHQRAEADFRCIDCHGGASFPNKLRVKMVAARDAVSYLLGRFEEPQAMRHPLWDEDCAQCHARFEASADDFHGVDVHNLPDFQYRCVECHRSHDRGGEPAFDFLERDHVLSVCAECHEEFKQ